MNIAAAEQWPTFSDKPYKERWEPLKPFLEQLYVVERRSARDVTELMKTRHKFYASENQYKRQFHVWEWTKNVPTTKKAAMCKQLQARAQEGKTSVVMYKGQEVDGKQLRRYMKDKARAARRDVVIGSKLGEVDFDTAALSGHALQCGKKIFMNWDMPYIDERLVKQPFQHHPSPLESAPTPASDVVVATPSSENAAPSPRDAPSPRNAQSPESALSPTAAVLLNSVKIERAHLFVHRRHTELLEGMNVQEKKIMTYWMNQYWLFAFRTTKTWGEGPRRWNASMLGFKESSQSRGLERTSQSELSANSPEYLEREWYTMRGKDDDTLKPPTKLCRWSIYNQECVAEHSPSPPSAAEPDEPADDEDDEEDNWQPWPDYEPIEECALVLRTSLQSNDFSSIPTEELPVSVRHVSAAVERAPSELLLETFGFAIMSRNINLVLDIIETEKLDDIASSGLFPLHLAVSYLDGSRACCSLFTTLVEGFAEGDASLRKLYINHLGHTVLDNVMITILKSHTSCSPGTVDEVFKKERRFAGDDVDICGRWDADSPRVQRLKQSRGNSSIPFSWKHVFCHTSVQAICHCIGALFGRPGGPDINAPSGLFTHHCRNQNCGRKLQLLPLHTLVITAIHLATHGSSGETLFGMVACLLSLLSQGANPLLKAEISLSALLSNDERGRDSRPADSCSHREMDPVELAEAIPHAVVSRWPFDVQMGWGVFYRVLCLAHQDRRPKRPHHAAAFDLVQIFGDDAHGADVNGSAEVDAMDVDDADGNVAAVDDEHAEQVRWRIVGTAGRESGKNFLVANHQLSAIWTLVQTEFTTYRRLKEGDPWVSPDFGARFFRLWSLKKRRS